MMTNARQNDAVEQREACQQAQKMTATCEQFHVTVDPIDWEQFGMRAPVKVNNIEIASLLDLYQRESDEILRRVQIKLFEHAALKAVQAPAGTKALIWSPVDVVKPQEFLNLWIITLETDQRIPIIETISNGKRVYEYYNYTLNENDAQSLAKLFGPAKEGEYAVGEQVTIQERERAYTGKVIYIIAPGKATVNRKHTSRGYHTIAGTAYTNDMASRYLIDCGDGFPHIVNQSQVSR
ncbi:hypothetical protein [Dictyobacter arantiisoli]|uniref:Uncharacterized protein n=1 Tax=Dictyobacter arantiisoli TaxID=2014874 RepID=A0A5A5THU4_9CHLR|nr:hypothetical protein [Dictyobacter arantiisoli]GCF11161.1 hypothetical protein KDI_47250 [Dictyobacter arantiisoli]